MHVCADINTLLTLLLDFVLIVVDTDGVLLKRENNLKRAVLKKSMQKLHYKSCLQLEYFLIMKLERIFNNHYSVYPSIRTIKNNLFLYYRTQSFNISR